MVQDHLEYLRYFAGSQRALRHPWRIDHRVVKYSRWLHCVHGRHTLLSTTVTLDSELDQTDAVQVEVAPVNELD